MNTRVLTAAIFGVVLAVALMPVAVVAGHTKTGRTGTSQALHFGNT
jgi:hypothetical protein